MKGKQKIIQSQEVSKYGVETIDLDNFGDSSENIQIKIKKPSVRNRYVQKLLKKKLEEKNINKTENNRNKNKIINRPIIDYQTLYKNLEEEYNDLKNKLNEKEIIYKSKLLSLQEKLKNNEDKYIEEINNYKKLLKNKNNHIRLTFPNNNLKYYSLSPEKDRKYKGSENNIYLKTNLNTNEIDEKKSKQVIILKKQKGELEKKEIEFYKTLKVKNDIIQEKQAVNELLYYEKKNILIELNKLKKEINLLQNELKNKSDIHQETIINLKDEINRRKQDNDKLNEELNKIKSQYEEEKQKNIIIYKTSQTKEDEKDKIINNYNQKIKDVIKEKENIQYEMNIKLKEQEKIIDNLKIKIIENENKNKNEIMKLKSENDKKEENYNFLKNEYDTKFEEIKNKNNQKDIIINENKKEIFDLKNQLEIANKNEQDNNKEMQKQIKELTINKKEIEQELMLVKVQNTELKENNELNLNSLKQKDNIIEESKKKIEDLINQNKNQSNEIISLNQKYNEFSEELKKEKEEKEKIKLEKEKLESVINEINIKYNSTKNEYDDNIKKIMYENQEKEKKYLEALEQRHSESDNYKKIIDQYESEKIKILDKLNILYKIVEQNEEIVKNIQKENLELKQQNKENNKILNSQIEIIKEQYKIKIEKDIDKIKKCIIKRFEDDLLKTKTRYNNLYLNREKDYDKKYNQLTNIILAPKIDLINEKYSYECTNLMFLSVSIYEGTEKAEFEIFLRNKGQIKWAEDSKLIVDKNSSDIIIEEIPLIQQIPKEEKSYKIIVNDMKRYEQGEYKIIFLFYSGGKIHGEKITALIKIQKNPKDEINKYIDKINQFRKTFNLSEDEYSNEKIFKTLKDYNFNFENAFSSFYN